MGNVTEETILEIVLFDEVLEAIEAAFAIDLLFYVLARNFRIQLATAQRMSRSIFQQPQSDMNGSRTGLNLHQGIHTCSTPFSYHKSRC